MPTLPNENYWSIAVAFGAALLALAVAGSAYGKLGGTEARLGKMKWDIKSWTTNLTIVAPLLMSTLGGASPLDKDFKGQHMSPTAYLMLSLFFALLAVAAPMAYLVTEKPAGGSVRPYVISNGITLWAVIGQILTLILLLDEVRYDRYVMWTVVAAQIFLAFIGLGNLVYSRSRM